MHVVYMPRHRLCPWSILVVVIFCLYGVVRVKSSVPSYEQPFYINTTALSISTVIYNPSSHYSKWVTRLLGQEAVFHNRSYFERKGHPLSAQEKRERSQIFNNYFKLPSEAILPSCSFEFTGFAVVDHAHPLSHRFMMTAPSVGLATLNFLNADGSEGDSWKCYYRGVYETANKRLKVLPEIHWPVFGYCPSPRADTSCLSLLASYRTALKSKLVNSMRDLLAEPVTKPQSSYDPQTILLPNKQQITSSSNHKDDMSLSPNIRRLNSNGNNQNMSSQFLSIFSRQPPITIPVRLDLHLMRHQTWSVHMDLDLMNIARKAKSQQRAVCAVLPYAAADAARRKVNEALAFEFIRYYSHLGFKVALYDRDGRHFDGIFHSAYSALHGRQAAGKASSSSNRMNVEEISKLHNLDLLYFNHTMLQLLWPDSPFPSEEVSTAADRGKLSRIIIMGDSDKRMTYTHCRSSLQHRYGIEQVLVADIDEFLYCPRATGSTLSQRTYLDSYIRHMMDVGVEQLVLKQRVNVAKAGDIATCMVNVIKRAEQVYHNNQQQRLSDDEVPSLFACVAAFRFVVKHFFDKSLHLAAVCPLTSFHHSSFLRFFDCYANSYVSASRVRRNFSLGGCSVVHLSTKVGQFNRTHPHDMDEVKRVPSELIAIAAGK